MEKKVKTKTLKIDVKSEFDFNIIGISSSESDLRLIWLVNKSLNLSLVKIEDLDLTKDDTNQLFIRYANEFDEHGKQIIVVANKSEHGVLLKEFQQIDYFIKIVGPFLDNEIDDLLSRIKAIREFLLCVRIPIQINKSFERLLLV